MGAQNIFPLACVMVRSDSKSLVAQRNLTRGIPSTGFSQGSRVKNSFTKVIAESLDVFAIDSPRDLNQVWGIEILVRRECLQVF